jgi:hypothetical protein
VVERDGSITELDDLGCLTIVDLAGSEVRAGFSRMLDYILHAGRD